MADFSAIEFDYVMSCFPGSGARILDVGCGQGKYLIPLSKLHQVVGVEKSLQQAERLRENGYRVVAPSEVPGLDSDFDYILMSHVIEHVSPGDLIAFLNHYLDLLKAGGKLVVATPLLWEGFYDDYDHVKPYTHRALSILFSDCPQQQQ